MFDGRKSQKGDLFLWLPKVTIRQMRELALHNICSGNVRLNSSLKLKFKA